MTDPAEQPRASNPVTADDVQVAARVLDGTVLQTPVLESSSLSRVAGGPVHLKCENLQRAGSFKIRGAFVRLAALDEAERARGVVAASAGNHAQGVALAARLLGIDATVFMPEGAALPKIAATRGYGAQVRFAGATVDEAVVAAREWAAAEGAVLIHPFDHPDVVAGQGTVGLEILQQVPHVRTVLVPTGGGGLVAGIAAALDGRDIEVVGVQAAGAAAWPASLAAGRPVTVPTSTMADGIAVGRPGEVPFATARACGVDVVTVTEEDLSRALLHLAERSKMVVEPAGAAGVAVLLAGHRVATPAVAVLSGGNVDPLLLLRVVRHGLAAAGRFLQLHVRLDDRPGTLATMLAELGAGGGNVMHVSHVRTAVDLAFDEVEIEVQVETRGPEHCQDVVRRLRASGYQVRPG